MTVNISSVNQVGDSAIFHQKSFSIRSALLIQESHYFAKALGHDFEEGRKSLVEMEDVDTDAFRHFVNYLYRDKLSVNTVDKFNDEAWVVLARAYVLGDRLGALGFTDVVLEPFCHTFAEMNHRKQTVFDLLELVCTELPSRTEAHQLRQVVLQYAALKMGRFRKDKRFEELLRGFCTVGLDARNPVVKLDYAETRFAPDYEMEPRSDTDDHVEPPKPRPSSTEALSEHAERVYRALNRQPGQFFTNRALADLVGQSRTLTGKAIGELRHFRRICLIEGTHSQ